MDDLPQFRYLYKTFKNIAEEAGGFFRQKEHYSISEWIDFILALHKSFTALELLFENDEELKSGKSITISPDGDFSKVTLDYKNITDEFETAVSIIYFNLLKQDIEDMFEYCKAKALPRETLILKKLFDKFLL